MTLKEAISLENECEAMFSKLSDRVSISMALIGKLRLETDDVFLTFDVETGKIVYISFRGYKSYLDDICDTVHDIVMAPDNNEKLQALLWSYDHRRELVE